jgi:hypothetical protein
MHIAGLLIIDYVLIPQKLMSEVLSAVDREDGTHHAGKKKEKEGKKERKKEHHFAAVLSG